MHSIITIKKREQEVRYNIVSNKNSAKITVIHTISLKEGCLKKSLLMVYTPIFHNNKYYHLQPATTRESLWEQIKRKTLFIVSMYRTLIFVHAPF